jgi:septum formation protein
MLILASSSPRRHELLRAAGIVHEVLTVPIDESRREHEAPREYVLRLAEEKARAISPPQGSIVLAADTVVAIENQVFLKPTGPADAARMLRALSGRDHWVITGICLLSETKCITDMAATRVSFVELDDAEIQEYIRSPELYDKAGAYAIQGLASKFIAGIEGCYQNVVGLPVSLVYQHLKSL